MKKSLTAALGLLFIVGLSGCDLTGDRFSGITVTYGVAAVLSAVLLLGGFFSVRNNKWFLTLFSSVLIVNAGYFALSAASGLTEALWANRFSYLGSVLLPLSMLMILLHVTNARYPKWLPPLLLGLAGVMFFIAATPGYLPIYYKEVSFAVTDGAGSLVKVYGPLHILYLFYLLCYFGAMVAVLIRASAKKHIDTTAHGVFLALAVFVNIGVWAIEQLVSIPFEILSLSYIISELFLLGVHLVMQENQALKDKLRQKEEERSQPKEAPLQKEILPDAAEHFQAGLPSLTPKERALLELYVTNISTKEIMEQLCIKENTLKYHSKNLYSKLGVSSRKQLTAIYNQIDQK